MVGARHAYDELLNGGQTAGLHITGPEELTLVEASRWKRWLPLEDRRRYWPEPASQALSSSDRKSTTRSSPWSAPSGTPVSCALAMGVDSEVLDFRAEGSCDGRATPRVRVDRGRGTSIRA
jgi:hypothetical protein